MERGPQHLPTATVLPLFAWLKNARGWGGGVDNPKGIEAVCLVCLFFFFFSIRPHVQLL